MVDEFASSHGDISTKVASGEWWVQSWKATVPILHRGESFGLARSFAGCTVPLAALARPPHPPGPITSIVLWNRSCYTIPQERLKPLPNPPTFAEYTSEQRTVASPFFFLRSSEILLTLARWRVSGWSSFVAYIIPFNDPASSVM